jgi:hypothetical protein
VSSALAHEHANTRAYRHAKKQHYLYRGSSGGVGGGRNRPPERLRAILLAGRENLSRATSEVHGVLSWVLLPLCKLGGDYFSID